jgi:tRNA (cytosine38-C5)-methyltransferase
MESIFKEEYSKNENQNNNNNETTNNEAIEVLELFSGIGGMHAALKLIKDQFPFKVIQAIDINTNANKTYELNFKLKPQSVKKKECNSRTNTKETFRFPKFKLKISLDKMKKEDFENLNASLWLASPPCQPHTRQGNQLDTEDNRSDAFLHLIQVLESMENPPTFLLFENVKGFETSNSHKKLVEVLKKRNYFFRDFLISPHQFKIPNMRLRYYLIAKRLAKQEEITNLKREEPWSLIPKYPMLPLNICNEQNEKQIIEYCSSIQEYMKKANYSLIQEIEPFLVANKVIEKYGRLMDVVSLDSHRSCCFTKGYGRLIEGTGSVLKIDSNNNNNNESSLRFFTPQEILCLHGFPFGFQFPSDLSTRQCYQLLGNGLNCFVVAQLLSYLFSKDFLQNNASS